MKKSTKLLAAMVVAAVVLTAGMAMADEIVQIPEHGSLWRLAQECGQPGAAWPAIMAKNPWLKVKVVKGQPVPVTYPGQPIVLPEGWSLVSEADDEENGVNTEILAAFWVDACDMAKNYPMPTILLFFVIIAVITARSVADERRKYRRESASMAEPETTRSSRHQRGQRESILLPR